jgi:hypothetical protein
MKNGFKNSQARILRNLCLFYLSPVLVLPNDKCGTRIEIFFSALKKKIAEFQVDDIFQSKLSGKKTFSIQKKRFMSIDCLSIVGALMEEATVINWPIISSS